MRKYITFLLIVCLLLCTFSINDIIANGSTEPDPVLIRKLDIYEKYQELQQVHVDMEQPYKVAPQDVNPYQTGEVREDILQSALQTTNFIRYLAYLSSDVEMDDSWNDMAQHTTVLLSANGLITHTPKQPTDMSDDFYKKAYQGAQTSNLHMHYGFELSLNQVIAGLMVDSDDRNIDRVGHRRWILNPAMTKVGFGLVDDEVFYAAMKVNGDNFNRVYTYKKEYDYIAWPSQTAFPIEYFESSTAWSVSLNEKKYDNDRIDDIKVSLKNLSTNEVQTFSKNQAGRDYYYFNVDNEGYAVPYSVIFRPNIDGFEDGDRFEVTITGIYTLNGDKTSITYQTEFFSLQKFEKDLAFTESLTELGVFKGTNQGLELSRTPTRIEGLIMLIRLLGKEEEALAMGDEPCVFQDVEGWAIGYVNYAYQNQITRGISADLFRPNYKIDSKSYMTFMLRALGYNDLAGDFAWSESLEKGLALNIIDETEFIELKGNGFLRYHLAYITYNTLHTPIKEENVTLLQNLIVQGAIPSEYKGI